MKKKRSIFLVGFFLLVFLGVAFSSAATAEELTIIFSGQSFSSLYPCHCPYEPDGGVARRSTLIKELRKEKKNLLLIETGYCLASGEGDQYQQNYELDSKRTGLYLKSLEVMGYDAILATGHEFVYGEPFLKNFSNLPFVSSNTDRDYLKSVIVKDLGWIKVGIVGLTDQTAAARGIDGWSSPAAALEKAVASFKKDGVGFIVVLSSLGMEQDKEIVARVSGVNVVIDGTTSYGSVGIDEQNGVLFCATWWQAKRLGILELKIEKGLIVNKSIDSYRLSSEIADDPEITSLLPACFSKSDCKKVPGLWTECQEGGTSQARCIYTGMQKQTLTVIEPDFCVTCRTQDFVGEVGAVIGESDIRKISDKDPQAQALIKEFGITMLPAYFLDKAIEKSPAYQTLEPALTKGSDLYWLNPARTGVSYLVDGDRVPDRLDVFFDFYNHSLPELFKLLDEFKQKHKDAVMEIHFLAIPGEDDEIKLRQGTIADMEEFARLACIDEKYPQRTLDYLKCRAGEKDSTWWEKCASAAKIDVEKVKECAQGPAAKRAIKKRIAKTQELKIASGPTLILENKEIVALAKVPTLEEFESFLRGEKKGPCPAKEDKNIQPN